MPKKRKKRERPTKRTLKLYAANGGGSSCPKWALVGCVIVGLSACSSGLSSDFCLLYEPGTLAYPEDPPSPDYGNHKDTAETIEWVSGNLAVYEALCD